MISFVSFATWLVEGGWGGGDVIDRWCCVFSVTVVRPFSISLLMFSFQCLGETGLKEFALYLPISPKLLLVSHVNTVPE